MNSSSSQIDLVRQKLSTAEGFAQAVPTNATLRKAGLVLLAVAVIGALFNLWQLGSASGWDWPLMFKHFFDADAVEFSGRRADRAAFRRDLFVWGPVVLAPIGAALLIAYQASKSGSGEKLFKDFQQRGWVAHQRKTGLQLKVGEAAIDISLLSDANISDEDYSAAVSRYASYVSTLNASQVKEVADRAGKAGVLNGVSASVLSPELPSQLIAARATKKDEPFVVVVPPLAGQTKYQISPIKTV